MGIYLNTILFTYLYMDKWFLIDKDDLTAKDIPPPPAPTPRPVRKPPPKPPKPAVKPVNTVIKQPK